MFRSHPAFAGWLFFSVGGSRFLKKSQPVFGKKNSVFSCPLLLGLFLMQALLRLIPCEIFFKIIFKTKTSLP